MRFEEIYGEYYTRIYNYCHRMTGDRESAGDLAQEVFTRVYSSLAGFREKSSLSTWVFSIAGNCCVDYFRRKKSLFNAMASLFQQVMSDGRREREKSMEDRVLDRHAGMAILEKLDPRDRSLLILKQYAGLSYRELAGIFRTTPSSISVMITRARKKALVWAEKEGLKFEMQRI